MRQPSTVCCEDTMPKKRLNQKTPLKEDRPDADEDDVHMVEEISQDTTTTAPLTTSNYTSPQQPDTSLNADDDQSTVRSRPPSAVAPDLSIEAVKRTLAARKHVLVATKTVRAVASDLLSFKLAQHTKADEVAIHKAMTVAANSRKNQKVTTSNPQIAISTPGGEEKRSVRQRVGRNYADVVRGDTMDVGGNIIFSGPKVRNVSPVARNVAAGAF